MKKQIKQFTDFSTYTLKDIVKMQNINQRDSGNLMTVLMYACDRRDVKICKYLFDNNVNFKALDVKDGEDAFYYLIVNPYCRKLRNIARMFYKAGYRFNPNKIVNASHGSRITEINPNVWENVKRLNKGFFGFNIVCEII